MPSPFHGKLHRGLGSQKSEVVSMKLTEILVNTMVCYELHEAEYR